MVKPIAVVDYTKCDPCRCGTGKCILITECKHKVIKQEEIGNIPYVLQDLCSGCGDCVKLCPLNAITMI